jgi:arginyl-tRNA synthetase
MEVPALLVKSNGTTIYFLRDLATIKYRNETWSPDLIVYEVGADQAFHFQQLFAVAQMLGYGGPEKFVHLAHGLIRWPTGKFSTRRGATIHLEEVLNEAIAGARKLMETAGVAKQLPEEEKQKTAEAIGIGAIKYNDLKQNPKTDIIFDWHQILTLAGNSGPYIQYTYARTQSVLRKADFSFKEAKEVAGFEKQKLSSEEEVLLRSFYCFPEVVIEAGESLAPNLLCNFLFDLSQKFNLFYDREKIIGSSTEEFRLLLTAAVGQVLENGLSLLGIEALERM